MRSKIQLDKLKAKSVIECIGEIRIEQDEKGTENARLNINYSDILSRLIVEAGTVCKHYASDLFISWESLLMDISNVQGRFAEINRFFGFREDGIDNGKDIETILSSPEVYGKNPYKSIFKLTVIMDKEHGRMVMSLYALMKMSNQKAKEIITDYVFGDFKIESLYKYVDSDVAESEKKSVAETVLTRALQIAVISLME